MDHQDSALCTSPRASGGRHLVRSLTSLYCTHAYGRRLLFFGQSDPIWAFLAIYWCKNSDYFVSGAEARPHLISYQYDHKGDTYSRGTMRPSGSSGIVCTPRAGMKLQLERCNLSRLEESIQHVEVSKHVSTTFW